MATYEEKKNIAIGFVISKAGFISSSVFDVTKPLTMEYTNDCQIYEKNIDEQIEEQKRFKIALEVWDEYEKDQKTAKKNLAELSQLLLKGNTGQLEKFLYKKHLADWLNTIFLEDEELNELTNKIKKSSSECRTIISTTIKKEISRLVNFKTLFEQIVSEL